MKEELYCLKKAVEALIGNVDWDLIPRLGLGLGHSGSRARLKPRLDKGKSKMGVGSGRSRQAPPKMSWHLKRSGPSFEKGSTSSARPNGLQAQQQSTIAYKCRSRHRQWQQLNINGSSPATLHQKPCAESIL